MDRFNTDNMKVSIFCQEGAPSRLPAEEVELLMELMAHVSDRAYVADMNMAIAVSFPNHYLHPRDCASIQSAVERIGGNVHVANGSILLLSTEDGKLVIIYLNGSLKGFHPASGKFENNQRGDDTDDDDLDDEFSGKKDSSATVGSSMFGGLTQEINF